MLEKTKNTIEQEEKQQKTGLLCEFSIMQISIICGFSSSQYFSYVFKKKTGLTPIQYREKESVFREAVDSVDEN